MGPGAGHTQQPAPDLSRRDMGHDQHDSALGPLAQGRALPGLRTWRALAHHDVCVRTQQRGTAGTAGAGRTGNAAPHPRQHHDGDAGPLVLRSVHLAPGGAGHGVPGDRRVPVQRPHADRADPDGHAGDQLPGRGQRAPLGAGGAGCAAGRAAARRPDHGMAHGAPAEGPGLPGMREPMKGS